MDSNSKEKLRISSFCLEILDERIQALAGFGVRTPGRTRLGPRECKVRMLWMKDIEEKNLIIFSADLLYFPDFLADKLSNFLQTRFGIERNSIVFSATHTHSGPSFGYFKTELSHNEYFDEVFKKLCSEIDKASLQFQARKMRAIVKIDESFLAVYRRKKVRNPRAFFLKHFTTMLPNLEASQKQPLCLVGFYEEDESLDFLVVSFACHPVFNTNNEVSSDYPGEVLSQLSKRLVCKRSLFLQGFCGDLRANITTLTPSFRFGIRNFCREGLKILSFGRIFKTYKLQDFNTFVQRLVEFIQTASQMLASEPIIRSIGFSSKVECRELPSKTKKTAKPIFIKKIRICNNLQFVAISAEVHSGYYEIIAKNFQGITVAIAMTERVMGYLPRSYEILDGGYEVFRSALNSGLDAPLDIASVKELEGFLESEF